MMNMEGGKDKKWILDAVRWQWWKAKFVDEYDEAQTHRHNLIIHQKMYPHDT